VSAPAETPIRSQAETERARRLAAATALLQAERAGVSFFWTPGPRGWSSPPELRFRAEPPDALSPELRAAIASVKADVLALLEPWSFPLNAPRVAALALLVVSFDPRWRQGSLSSCAACRSSTVWTSPEGVPLHPSCDPLLGVL